MRLYLPTLYLLHMRLRLPKQILNAFLACSVIAWAVGGLAAQIDTTERAFPQSKAEIEKVLKTMQASLAGRLPVLDGFATAQHPLERYQRGFYQATAQVSPAANGGSVVRITVKVTAWYDDPIASKSGYQLLTSNGRLEGDLLDQLGEQLAKSSPAPRGNQDRYESAESVAPPPADETRTGVAKTDISKTDTSMSTAKPSVSTVRAAGSSPTVSSTQPRTATAAPGIVSNSSAPPASGGPGTSGPASAPASANPPPASSSGQNLSSMMNQSLAAEERALPRPSGNVAVTKSDNQLQAGVESLQEVLKSQAHPKNLVAVKKSGTPVVGNPSLSAKPLFLASEHDEFEMLEFNRDWVHVRISGLSRGWIWRNSLEMPDGIPDTAAQSAPAPPSATDLFHVTREETAPFPGDWQPLRGKNVKILSVQMVDEAHPEGNSQDKLEYAKFILDKTYGEMRAKTQDLAGIVVIFDSADGGMIAATLTTLQQWKAGTLSDAALWHACFFDPPETFTSGGSSGAQ